LKKIFTIIFAVFAACPVLFAQPGVVIEQVLAAACGQPEAQNEMVRFKVGNTPLQTSNFTINFTTPIAPFAGLCQNANTASKTAQLNAQINPVFQDCGIFIEPLNGILPAGANVLFITSEFFNVNAHSFENLAEPIYVIYQCGARPQGGHFHNHNGANTNHTLTISFGIGFSSSLTYNRTSLPPGAGSFAFRNPNGTVGYGNNGCELPVNLPNPSFNLPNTICPLGGAVNLNDYITGTTGGTFSGEGVTDNTLDPSQVSGSIEITYTITTGLNNDCVFENSQTITVLPTLSADWDNENLFCTDAEFLNLNERILGEPGGIFTGDGITNNQLNLTTTTFPVSITYSVGSTFCPFSQTLILDVEPIPPTPVLLSVEPGCANETGSTINLTGTGNYLWYSEPELVNQINTGNSYLSPLLENNVTYYVVNELNNCFSETLAVETSIIPIPDAPTINGDLSFSQNQDEVVFEVSGDFTINWFNQLQPNTIIYTGASYSPINYTGGTNYFVNQQNGACVSESILVEPIIIPQPDTPTFEAFTPPCIGTSVTVSSVYSNPVAWYSDLNGTNVLSTNSTFVSPIINTSTTFYLAGFNGLCRSNLVPILVEPAAPQPILISHEGFVELCNEPFLDVSISNADEIFWSSGDTTELTRFSQNGTYLVNTSNDCFNESFELELVFTTVSASFNQNIFKSLPPLSANFTNTSVSNAEPLAYSWRSEPDFNFAFTTNFENNYRDVGDYEITLIATTINGCTDSVKTTVRVLPETSSEVFIPNSFTPNGDGINDVFKIEGFGFTEFDLKIYNRWGSLIFETNNSQVTWDGSQNGNPLPSGYYGYRIQIKGAEPRFIYKTGSILLLR